jgi:hypothetical protein
MVNVSLDWRARTPLNVSRARKLTTRNCDRPRTLGELAGVQARWTAPHGHLSSQPSRAQIYEFSEMPPELNELIGKSCRLPESLFSFGPLQASKDQLLSADWVVEKVIPGNDSSAPDQVDDCVLLRTGSGDSEVQYMLTAANLTHVTWMNLGSRTRKPSAKVQERRSIGSSLGPAKKRRVGGATVEQPHPQQGHSPPPPPEEHEQVAPGAVQVPAEAESAAEVLPTEGTARVEAVPATPGEGARTATLCSSTHVRAVASGVAGLTSRPAADETAAAGPVEDQPRETRCTEANGESPPEEGRSEPVAVLPMETSQATRPEQRTSDETQRKRSGRLSRAEANRRAIASATEKRKLRSAEKANSGALDASAPAPGEIRQPSVGKRTRAPSQRRGPRADQAVLAANECPCLLPKKRKSLEACSRVSCQVRRKQLERVRRDPRA